MTACMLRAGDLLYYSTLYPLLHSLSFIIAFFLEREVFEHAPPFGRHTLKERLLREAETAKVEDLLKLRLPR